MIYRAVIDLMRLKIQMKYKKNREEAQVLEAKFNVLMDDLAIIETEMRKLLLDDTE
jgi:hypothetical protein